MLLVQVQVLVETAEVLRVVEVFDGQRQFCHLTACNFDYDAGSDIFTIGTQVIANPFGCLQQYEISLVAPIHAACTHTKWEQNKLGVIHRTRKQMASKRWPWQGKIKLAWYLLSVSLVSMAVLLASSQLHRSLH